MAVVHPTEAERLALCEWLTANSIDINTVPLHSEFTIADGPDGQRIIHYTEFVLSDGCKQVDPQAPSEAHRRPASAVCAVEPPGWLHIPGGRS